MSSSRLSPSVRRIQTPRISAAATTLVFLLSIGMLSALSGPAGAAGPLDGTWTRLGPPRPLTPVLTYDTLRQRVVVWGGELWVKPLSTDSAWIRLPVGAVSNQPSGADVLIYDPVRDRLIGFVGYGYSASEVWTLPLSSSNPYWSLVIPQNAGPSRRTGTTGIYDPVRDRLIVFGGCGCSNEEAWAFDLATRTWTQLASGPPGRFDASAIYDPVRDRMVVFGGYDGAESYRNDTWALSLSESGSWSQLDAGSGPSARDNAAAVYDEIGDRMIVMGGPFQQLGEIDTWAFSFGSGSWEQLSPSGPLPSQRSYAPAVRAGAGAVLVGGLPYSNVPSDLSWTDESWLLSFSPELSWSRFFLSPGKREGATAVADLARDRVLVCGGERGTESLGDLWSIPLSNPVVWTQIAATGLPGRAYHVAVLDSAGDRLLVVGGEGATSDVYSLDLANPVQWTALATSGAAPAPRSSSCGIFDPLRRRLILFGGDTGAGQYQNDLRVLDLTSLEWTNVPANGAVPDPRAGASAIYDAFNDRMLLFGGITLTGYVNDFWSLELSSLVWSAISAGNPPPPRAWHAAIYDEGRRSLVVQGGASVQPVYNDDQAWRWIVTGIEPWRHLTPAGSPPVPVHGMAAAYDRDGGRMFIFGGMEHELGPLGELSVLEWGAPLVSVIPRTASRLELTAAPNPSRARAVLAFTLPRAGRCVLEIFDPSGRRVSNVLDARMEAGAHRIEWALRNERGGRVEAGLYFARLTAAGERASRRLVVLGE